MLERQKVLRTKTGRKDTKKERKH